MKIVAGEKSPASIVFGIYNYYVIDRVRHEGSICLSQ